MKRYVIGYVFAMMLIGIGGYRWYFSGTTCKDISWNQLAEFEGSLAKQPFLLSLVSHGKYVRIEAWQERLDGFVRDRESCFLLGDPKDLAYRHWHTVNAEIMALNREVRALQTQWDNDNVSADDAQNQIRLLYDRERELLLLFDKSGKMLRPHKAIIVAHRDGGAEASVIVMHNKVLGQLQGSMTNLFQSHGFLDKDRDRERRDISKEIEHLRSSLSRTSKSASHPEVLEGQLCYIVEEKFVKRMEAKGLHPAPRLILYTGAYSPAPVTWVLVGFGALCLTVSMFAQFRHTRVCRTQTRP